MSRFRGKVGQLLLQEALPEELRATPRVLDKKGLEELLREVATNHPEKYRDVSHKLNRMGYEAAESVGGYSFGLSAMRRSAAANAIRDEVAKRVNYLLNSDELSDDEREKHIISILGEAAPRQQKEILSESLKENNPLALQIASGARGKPMNLASLRGSDMLYVDHRDRPLPIPILRSYAEGLSPAEYWAGAYGARKGVIDIKLKTADAGFFGKQLNQATHRLLVTRDDDDPFDGIPRGLPVSVDDRDSEGALLAHPAGGLPRNTVLTLKTLKKLQDQGISRILVRSPTVGGPREGGVFSRDIGVREAGRLPLKGEMVGLRAAQAMAEPLSQSQLCLAKGTLVRMANGDIKPIETIQPGESVLGANRRGDTFPSLVKNTFQNGVRHCIRWQFGGLVFIRELVCTEDHKILAQLWATETETSRQLEIVPVSSACHTMAAVGIRREVTDPVETCGTVSWHTPDFLTAEDPPRYCGLDFVDREQNYWEGFNERKRFEFLVRMDLGPRYAGSYASVGNLETFDIEVDNEDHLFVLANGLVVSNSSKHSGGVAGAAKGVSGFAYINSLVQAPKVFPGSATHSQQDGRVHMIEKAPAGGHFITIEGHQHFVPEGLGLKVKIGDEVEAGDVLSEGIPHPAEVVKFKGIGEGRRYFTQALQSAFQDAGIRAHRRNIELISRGLVNHVRLTDEFGDGVPGDILNYNDIESSYKPREDAAKLEPRSAVGQYLEKPYLHYSIGTKIRKNMLPDFDDFGVKEISVHKDPPPFEPEMIRGMYNLQSDPDWQTRMLGSGLKGGVLTAVHRGGTSDENSTSYVPSLAHTKDFGKVGPFKIEKPKTMLAKVAVSVMSNPTGGKGLTSGTEARPTPTPSPIMAGAAVSTPPAPALPKMTTPGGSTAQFGDFFHHLGNVLRGPGQGTRGFKNSVTPSEFEAKFQPAPAAVPAASGGSSTVGNALHLGLAVRGLSRAAAPFSGAVTAVGEPVRWLAGQMGAPEDIIGRPYDYQDFSNRQQNANGYLDRVGINLSNPHLAAWDLLKGVGYDIPKAIIGHF